MDAQAAVLLYGLGQAQMGTQARLAAQEETLASFSRAFDYYLGAGDVERALIIASHDVTSNIGGELIEKGLALVPPDSHDAGRLLSRYIMPLRADYQRAQDALHRALAIAHQHQDQALEMRTLVSGACVNFTNCRFEQSLHLNLQSIELAAIVDQPTHEAHARYDLMGVLYATGDLEGAARHALAMLGPAERSGIHQWQVSAMESNENVSSAKGDWEAARNFSEQGLAMSPRQANLLGCRALLEYQVGDFDAGDSYLERLVEGVQWAQPGTPVPYTVLANTWYTVPLAVIPVVARVTRVAVHFDLVEQLAQGVFSSPATHPGPLRAAQIGLALIAVQRGDRTTAGDLYAQMAPIRGTMSPQCPMGPGLAGDRVLALLSHTMGEPEQAAKHFEDALAFCRRAGYRPELAWTCCDYADTLLQRNSEGDRDKAMSLLDESLAISSELGMRPLMERVLSRREILGA